MDCRDIIRRSSTMRLMLQHEAHEQDSHKLHRKMQSLVTIRHVCAHYREGG